MSFLQWLMNGLPVGVILFFWQILKWAYNHCPLVYRLKKTQGKYDQLCQEECNHLVLLNSLTDELINGGLKEAIAYLEEDRLMPSEALRILNIVNLNLSHVVDRVNKELANAQKIHNRTVAQLRDEIKEIAV